MRKFLRLKSYFLSVWLILPAVSTMAAEIQVVPQKGTMKVLFALTSLEDLPSDVPFISEEKIEVYRRALGNEAFERWFKAFMANVDQSDPLEQLKDHAAVLQDYMKEASYGKLNIQYDVSQVSVPLSKVEFSMECTHSLQRFIPEFSSSVPNEEEYDKIQFLTPPLDCNDIGGINPIGEKYGFVKSSYLTQRIPLGNMIHEFGHGLGALHTEELQCPDSPIGSNCLMVPYGSVVDIMGANKGNGIDEFGHFSSYHKEKFGWISPTSEHKLVKVEREGKYLLSALDSLAPGTKGIKIEFHHSDLPGEHWLYIDYRVPQGFDLYQRRLGVFNPGAIFLSLIKVDEKDPRFYKSAQLRFNLKTGETFEEGNLSITLLNAGEDAELEIKLKK